MAKKKELWSTFRGNNDFPVYNWFYFTEAFSRGLVRNIFLKYVQKPNAEVLDPFCGTGTTLLVSKEFGFNAIGTDVSPYMCQISRSKTNSYDSSKLAELLPKVIENAKEAQVNVEKKWLNKFFYSDNLNDLYKLKETIQKNIKLSETEKDFFIAVLIKTLEATTRSQKQGSSLRMKKIEKKDVFAIYNRVANNFIKDITKFQKKNPSESKIEINNVDFLDFKTNKKFDVIVTSPPYLNKTEYTRRMGIELDFLGYESILSQHLGITKEYEEKEWVYKDFFEELRIYPEDYKMFNQNYSWENYFKSLEMFVEKSKDLLKEKGILAIVIAGGCFPNKPVDIYNYMQKLYRSLGLEIIDLKIDREIQCHGKERTNKTGKIKEFTIIGRKS